MEDLDDVMLCSVIDYWKLEISVSFKGLSSSAIVQIRTYIMAND